MGFFGPSKRERQEQAELADKLTASAEREAADARKCKARAAEIRRSEKNARYPDPIAARAITRDLETNRRISEQNARDLRRVADDAKRSSNRWF